ncbi:MAG: PorT family protein [Sphingobacteriales bacterium JAD_PAG50586_3]|nr:MAG: PorT family protein [Sphingobacteriales bacterium JAD_PAG50586_3]
MSLNAQEFKKFRLGLAVSPNLGWIKPNEKDFDSDGVRAGIGGGLVMDVFFAKNYGITTGVQVMNVGGKVVNEGAGYSFKHTYKNQYVQIPFGLKMKTNDFSGFNIYGLFGVSFEYCFRARYDYRYEVAGITVSDSDLDAKDDDLARDLRMGLNVGLGTEYNIAGSTSLFFGLTYNNGIIGAYKNSDQGNGNTSTQGNLNYFALNVGVLF